MRLLKTLVVLVLISFSALVAATPGRVDALGCHNSKKIGWHCHRASAVVGGETIAAREKRLLRQCKNKPSAGVCTGYTGGASK